MCESIPKATGEGVFEFTGTSFCFRIVNQCSLSHLDDSGETNFRTLRMALDFHIVKVAFVGFEALAAEVLPRIWKFNEFLVKQENSNGRGRHPRDSIGCRRSYPCSNLPGFNSKATRRVDLVIVQVKLVAIEQLEIERGSAIQQAFSIEHKHRAPVKQPKAIPRQSFSGHFGRHRREHLGDRRVRRRGPSRKRVASL